MSAESKKQNTVCNLCGKPGRSVRSRTQYPAHSCASCYRRWKRSHSRRTQLSEEGAPKK